MNRRTILVLGLGSMLALLVGVGVAFATSLPGSTFEIDTPSANLKVDNPAPSIDWASVSESRKADDPSGSGDNSFGNGTKEDTAVPSVTAGGIPPNKSDLKNFGVYLETTSTGRRFLNLFWHRVQDPSGTTNMDFEFNQSSTISGNGVTPVRTAGDLLIQYDLSNGGTNPQLFVSRWVTSGVGSQCEAGTSLPCWSDKVNLSAAGNATGSINTAAIPAAEADGLGDISARTFGEAQIDFDALTGGSGTCTSFGSAYLKSRSSDSFTAALKDFIAPTATGLNNCATVIIRKQTNPEENPNATSFGFTKAFTTQPPSAPAFSLQDDGAKTFTGVVQATDLTVTEDAPPAGWDLQSIDCSASTGVTPTTDVGTRKVTFNIDAATDVLDCTYTNRAQGKIVVDKVTDPSGDPQSFEFDLTGGPSNPTDNFFLTDEDTPHQSAPLLAGSGYDVTETVPAGWTLSSASCDQGESDVTNITVDAGQTVTCTFNNSLNRGKIVVKKETDPDGSAQSFDFTLQRGGTDVIPGFSLKDGESKDSGALLPQSGYDVTEADQAGWTLSSASCDQGESDVTNITVDAGQTVTCTFNNTLNRGKIVVDKVTDPSGDPQSFEFDLTGGPSNPTDNFFLTDEDTPHQSAPLLPGPGYDVTETVPADWELTSASCDQGESDVTNITVDAGQTVTCTFNNSKQTTSIATEQSFIPQDKATINGTGNGTFDGTVDFRLYTGSTCDDGGTLLYEDLDNALDGNTAGSTANTNNDGTGPDGYTINGDGGTFSWKVTYEDDQNHPAESTCKEESTVTIDNDNTPTP